MAPPNPIQCSKDGSRGKEVGNELPGWMLSSSRSSESLVSLEDPATAVVRSVNQELAVAVHRYKEWTEIDSRVEEMVRLLSLLDCGDVTELHRLAAGQPSASLLPRAKLIKLLKLRKKVSLCYIECQKKKITDLTDDF